MALSLVAKKEALSNMLNLVRRADQFLVKVANAVAVANLDEAKEKDIIDDYVRDKFGAEYQAADRAIIEAFQGAGNE